MPETLRSVGIDVGTTTTQLVVSELRVENQASAFSVPRLTITERKIVYESPVYFTPLLSGNLVDGESIRSIVEKEYTAAGITRQSVDTGAIIITGETSRKENARAVLAALSDYAGEFVVATAGPDLESVLAAKGAGAVAFSEQTEAPVLHMDIGGGTSNLALLKNGKVVQTGCLNVGGRLIKTGSRGEVTYISPVLAGLTHCRVGEVPSESALREAAETLTNALEMAAGLREPTDLLKKLTTEEITAPWHIPEETPFLSFSGGVADCIENEREPSAFGDIGVYLGQAIRKSRLCAGKYRLGSQTIRATVIGAGSHSTQLSGSTVFYRHVEFPMKNLPVVRLTANQQEQPEQIAQALRGKDAPLVALSLPGYASPDYEQVIRMADAIAKGIQGMTPVICLEGDMAKALGHSLCLRLPPETPCLCIDQVAFTEDSYLDVGSPVGSALPVVVKTLVFSREE